MKKKKEAIRPAAFNIKSNSVRYLESNQHKQHNRIINIMTNKGQTKCINCNRYRQKGKEYCYFCDPTIPASEKAEKRGNGGRKNRKIPHNLRGDNYRPLSVENIRLLLEDIITKLIDANEDDLRALAKDIRPWIPKAAEYAMLERLIQLSEDISLLKENRVNLLEGNYVDDLIRNRNGS